MSADILLAHCIAAAKVRRQSQFVRGVASQGLARRPTNSVLLRSDYFLNGVTSTAGAPDPVPLPCDADHSQGYPTRGTSPTSELIAQGAKMRLVTWTELGRGV